MLARTLVLVLLLLVEPVFAVCSPTCSRQDFDTDPFYVNPQDGRSPWTAFSDDADCPVTWDSVLGRLQRKRSGAGACNNTMAYARYNGLIAKDGCAIYKITENTGGTAFEEGGGFRHQSTQDELTIPPFLARFGVLRMEVGLAGPLRWATDRIYDAIIHEEDAGFGPLVVGDYFGWCQRGVADAVTVRTYLWHAYPGYPVDQNNWGVPDDSAVFTNACSGTAAGCDDYGTMFTVWFGANSPAANDVSSIDDFEVFSCP